MAMIGATAGKIDRPIGMSVRVVADWLVVSAARMNIARANMSGAAVATSLSSATI